MDSQGQAPQVKGHRRLGASSSVPPPLNIGGAGHVSHWLSQHQELMGLRGVGQSEATHAPLSPQSSESSGSGSGSEQGPHEDSHGPPSCHPPSERNTFIEEHSGMRGELIFFPLMTHREKESPVMEHLELW